MYVEVTFTKNIPKQEFSIYTTGGSSRVSVNVSPAAIETINVSINYRFEYRNADFTTQWRTQRYDVQIQSGYTTASADISDLHRNYDIINVEIEIRNVKGSSGNPNIIYNY